ncbi:MAG: hypothetical protein KDA45_07810, partial [Planctomycetales bacterium]|nr:hypothetical protein [Planctomycetales bacterium]
PADPGQSSGGESNEPQPEAEPPQSKSAASPQVPADPNSADSQAAAESPTDEVPPPEEEQGEAPATPAGQLTAAEPPADGEPPAGSATVPASNTREGLMSKEEALKLLQAVRDRDMLRRLRQEQRERARRVPVERDW